MSKNNLQWAITEANRLVEVMTVEELKQFTFDRLVDELLATMENDYEFSVGDPGDEQQ